MKRGFIIVVPVVLAAVVVTGLTLFQMQETAAERAVLEDKMAAMEAANDKGNAALDELRQQLGETQLAAAEAEAQAREKITALEAKLVAAEAKQATAAEDDWEDLGAGGEAVVEAAVADEPKRKGFGAVLESMMKDESVKKMMRQSQMVMLDRTYGKLFAKLGLSDERLEQLKTLLVERQMAGAERGMDFLTVGNDKEKMTALMEDLKLEREAADAEIEAMLKPDEFAELQAYEETLGERMQVSQFAQVASASGEPLTPDQTESLIDLMHESNREALGEGFDHKDPTQAMQAMQSEDGIAGMLEKMDLANERMIEKSGGILTPGQYDAFVQHQKQQAKMQKVGLKMMQGMMGADKKEE